jgi:hypothetical protein
MKYAQIFILILVSIMPQTAYTQTGKSKDTLAGQTKPDLSGTWVLDLSLSDYGKSKNSLLFDELVLVIAHHDPELKVTRKMIKEKREASKEFTLYTDGRGKSQLVFTGQMKSSAHALIKTKVIAKWDGNTLIAKGSTEIHNVPEGTVFSIEAIETWELSPDGNILTLSSWSNPLKSHSPNIYIQDEASEKVKRVFKRIS